MPDHKCQVALGTLKTGKTFLSKQAVFTELDN